MRDPISNKAVRRYVAAMYPGQSVRVVCTREGETHVKGEMPRGDGGPRYWSKLAAHTVTLKSEIDMRQREDCPTDY